VYFPYVRAKLDTEQPKQEKDQALKTWGSLGVIKANDTFPLRSKISLFIFERNADQITSI